MPKAEKIAKQTST